MAPRLLPLLASAYWLASAGCTPHPYSAAAYEHVDTSIVYTIICHNGKRTLRIPADEWELHKEHHDYRGPCRARGIPNVRPTPNPKHTDIAYDQREERAKWSREEWARHQEAQALLPAPDTLGAPRRN